MARVAQITPTFRDSLDKTIQGDASMRRRVMVEIRKLLVEALPISGDREALLPWPGSVGWVHEVHGLSIWLQYQFDSEHVNFLSVWSRPPIFVEFE